MMKLQTVRSEIRYTPNMILVKLVGSHSISQIQLRISEIKRTKMVRTVNVYYSNRAVQNVIELKNKRSMWLMAKSCSLTAGQTEVKIDFPLPIVACNVIIQFSDFYNNLQESFCQQFVEQAVSLLKRQNGLLATHPNSHIYSQLRSLVDFDGFYLESEPCVVCNNPEIQSA